VFFEEFRQECLHALSSLGAILTGQHIWRLEEAGNIHRTLPKKFITYTEVLEKAGYTIGFTGKGWSPGRLAAGGRDSNPAGQEFGKRRLKPPFRGMRNTDYAANFDDFLGQLLLGNSFCRPPWMAVREAGKVGSRGTPIRVQETGCGARHRLQRCRKQGAVHATGCKGAASRVGDYSTLNRKKKALSSEVVPENGARGFVMVW
jgi:hypothetical protein